MEVMHIADTSNDPFRYPCFEYRLGDVSAVVTTESRSLFMIMEVGGYERSADLTHQNLLMYMYLMLKQAASREKAAKLFHALSDETRIEVLESLKDGEQCVCELMESMKAAQSRLSFHLKVLKDAGLLLDRREGRWMYYSLNREGFEELEEIVTDLQRSANVTRSSKSCC